LEGEPGIKVLRVIKSVRKAFSKGVASSGLPVGKGDKRGISKADKGRFFTFGLGQDKGDKEDLVTRE